MIRGSIPWQPQSKERPRHSRGGHSYTPANTRKAEAAIVDELWRQGLVPDEPLDDPLRLGLWFSAEHIWFEMDVVSDYTEKGMHRDVDNLQKLFLDAAEGHLFLNDKQVVDLRGVKL